MTTTTPTTNNSVSSAPTSAPPCAPAKPRLPASLSQTDSAELDSNKRESARAAYESAKEAAQLAAAEAAKNRPAPPTKPKELDGYVGFANLPNQVYRKAVKKGFEFTLMVVGGCIYI